MGSGMTLRRYLQAWLRSDELPNLRRSLIELNSYRELQKIFNWSKAPILDRPDLDRFEYVEDVNERRVRDAESIATVVRNCEATAALEIGTSTGRGTVLMAANAPQARIYTVNIPPEEIVTGSGGRYTTIALAKEDIGKEYRARGMHNITQIYANTATWVPEIELIDVAFIDGCHDTEFVINDTRKILPFIRPGGFLLWHDFNPSLSDKFEWLRSVCLGVEHLYATGLLKGRMYQVRDSWVGVYRVAG